MTLAITALVAVMLVSAILATSLRNLLSAALAVGLGSVALAAILFLMDAPYAGGFELSVGAGLIAVLFVVAITLTESIEAGRHGP